MGGCLVTGEEKGGVERRQSRTVKIVSYFIMDPKDTPTQNVKIECRDIGDEEIWGNVEREYQRGLTPRSN